MGLQIDLHEGEHKLLAQRIEEIITSQPSLFPYSEAIELLAQLYASKAIHRLSEKQTILEEGSESKEIAQDFVNIDVNSIEKSEPRTVGAEHLMLQMAEQRKLSQKLHPLGVSEKDTSIALGAIIARTVAPESGRSIYTWLSNSSGLKELLDIDFKKSSLDKLYQISDKLLTHKNALEKHL